MGKKKKPQIQKQLPKYRLYINTGQHTPEQGSISKPHTSVINVMKMQLSMNKYFATRPFDHIIIHTAMSYDFWVLEVTQRMDTPKRCVWM